ncbi:hypothetical protein CSB37_03715 [bacterium DOLZORAL124_38_8]|nr:MAG: hypothetical protein CSB37_03715 [bacterium DOLZORAL124_38_8]
METTLLETGVTLFFIMIAMAICIMTSVAGDSLGFLILAILLLVWFIDVWSQNWNAIFIPIGIILVIGIIITLAGLCKKKK